MSRQSSKPNNLKIFTNSHLYNENKNHKNDQITNTRNASLQSPNKNYFLNGNNTPSLGNITNGRTKINDNNPFLKNSMRSKSKNGIINHSLQRKNKSELGINSSYEHYLISPQSTKTQNAFNKVSQEQKFGPLSTRNTKHTQNKENTNEKEVINVMNLLIQNNIPLDISNIKVNFPNFDSSKCSVKSMQVTKAYGANTYQGIIR